MNERIQDAAKVGGNEFTARMRALNWKALGVALVLVLVGILLAGAVNEIVGGVVAVVGLVVMWLNGWHSEHHTAEALSDE